LTRATNRSFSFNEELQFLLAVGLLGKDKASRLTTVEAIVFDALKLPMEISQLHRHHLRNRRQRVLLATLLMAGDY
jgi:hypothetical protein